MYQVHLRNILAANTRRSILQPINRSIDKNKQVAAYLSSYHVGQAEASGPICIYVETRQSYCRSVRISDRLAPLALVPHIQYNSVLLCQELAIRQFHSTRSLRDGEPSSKPSSKVEETVNALTEAIKEKKEGTVAVVPKRPLYKRIQDEVIIS